MNTKYRPSNLSLKIKRRRIPSTYESTKFPPPELQRWVQMGKHFPGQAPKCHNCSRNFQCGLSGSVFTPLQLRANTGQKTKKNFRKPSLKFKKFIYNYLTIYTNMYKWITDIYIYINDKILAEGRVWEVIKYSTGLSILKSERKKIQFNKWELNQVMKMWRKLIKINHK